MLTRLLLGICLVAVARADQAADVARLHIEAIGGAANLAKFSSFQATGIVRIGEHSLRMGLVAQRPNRVRTIAEAEGYVLIQAYDGVNPPWEIDSRAPSSEARLISDQAAREFIGDAEFDDPLASPADRGYSLDYAGTVEIDGKRMIRILATYRLTDTFELLLDEATFFIVRRYHTRQLPNGREVRMERRFDDFRTVAGVIVPFHISIYVGDRLLSEMVLESVEPNPPLSPTVFRIPETEKPLVDVH